MCIIPWLIRSADGGAHWEDVSGAAEGYVEMGEGIHLAPLVVAPGGRHVYLLRTSLAGNAGSGRGLMWSVDKGMQELVTQDLLGRLAVVEGAAFVAPARARSNVPSTQRESAAVMPRYCNMRGLPMVLDG